MLQEAASSWVDDHAPSMGAALAFYTLFSIAPLLLIVISVAGLVFGQQAARGEILEQITGLVGVDSARAIESLLQGLNHPGAGVMGTLVGLVAMLIGATTVFAELQDAMDRIWRAPSRPSGGGLWRMLRARMLSLGLVLGIGFLLIVSLIASAALAALGKWWEVWFNDVAVLANVLNVAVSFALIATMFAMIYKWIPRVKVAWRDVWVGAALTAALFTVGKTLIGLYIGRSGVASPFGAAASLVVLLLWVYYSAQIFLLGAEFTWVYARRMGSLKGAVPDRLATSPRVPLRDAVAPGTPARVQAPERFTHAVDNVVGITSQLHVHKKNETRPDPHQVTHDTPAPAPTTARPARPRIEHP
jgi:membrane protein